MRGVKQQDTAGQHCVPIINQHTAVENYSDSGSTASGFLDTSLGHRMGWRLKVSGAQNCRKFGTAIVNICRKSSITIFANRNSVRCLILCGAPILLQSAFAGVL